MQVVTVETSAGQTRYYLANDDGTPVEPVLQYLRFRDNAGAARKTSSGLHLSEALFHVP